MGITISENEFNELDRETIRKLLPDALKVVLYTIAKNEAPEVIAELNEFANDRGSIHSVFWDYALGRSIEGSVLNFWDTRSDADSFRLEATVGAILLTLALSWVAQATYEYGKNALSKKLGKIDPALIRRLRERASSDVISLYSLLQFRNCVYSTPGGRDRDEFRKIYAHMTAGGSLADYVSSRDDIAVISPPKIEMFEKLARGLALTPQAEIDVAKADWARTVTGTSMSAYSGFGVVRDFTSDRLRQLGLRGIDGLVEHASRALSEQARGVPHGFLHLTKSSILMVDADGVIGNLVKFLELKQLRMISGFACIVGGQTSHGAVWARGMSRAAIQVAREDMLFDYQFAAIAGDNLMYSPAFPTNHAQQISNVLSYQSGFDERLSMSPSRRE